MKSDNSLISTGIPTDASLVTPRSSVSDLEFAACLHLLQRVWPSNGESNPTAIQELESRNGNECSGAQEYVMLGRFRLLDKIGEGGFGLVFRAYDSALGRDVAIKIPRPHLVDSEQSRERFLYEAQAGALLDHPAIVPVLEVVEAGTTSFIVSPYCSGPNLAQWLHDAGHAPPQHAAWIIAQLAGAVAHAHDRGVLHRDLKPANVLLDANCAEATQAPLGFVPRLTDFGLAKILSKNSILSLCIVGTLQYMSPEQAAGRSQDIGVRSDVWSLGAILYELLSGHQPFEGDGPLVLHRIQNEEPRCLSARTPSIPADLINICHRCLQKDAAFRYSSANELREDLNRFLRGEPVSARHLNVVARTHRWVRRRPMISALAVSLLVVAVAGLGGVGWEWHRANLHAHAAQLSAERAQSNLLQAQDALLDFSWLVQEFAIYRRPEDPAPNDLWDRVRFYSPGASDPSAPLARPMTAAHSLFLANQSAASGDDQTALRHFDDGTSLWREIVQEQPSNHAYRRALALASYSHAVSLKNIGNTLAAQNKFRDARRAFAADLTDATLDAEALLKYADVAETLGKSLKLRNRRSESLDAFREALATAKEVYAKDPNLLQAKYLAATFAAEVGQVRIELGHRQAALAEYDFARKVADQLCNQVPDNENYLILNFELAMAAAETQRRENNVRRAALDYQEALEYAGRGLKSFPDPIPWNRRLAAAYAEFGKFKLRFKNYELAKVNFARADEIWKMLKHRNALPEREAVRWGTTCYELARLNERQKEYEQAVEYASQATVILEATRQTLREGREGRLAREGASALVARLRNSVVTVTED